jgi:hypothetical protein
VSLRLGLVVIYTRSALRLARERRKLYWRLDLVANLFAVEKVFDRVPDVTCYVSLH